MTYNTFSQEICGDNIDNDNDGLVDEVCVPFECDGSLYQSVNENNNYLLYEVSTNPIQFNLVSNLSSSGVINSFNSLAYNPVDNLMYGMGISDARLYRIDATGAVEYLGDVAGLSDFKNGGTFDNLGNYYVYGDNILRRVDINNLTFTQIGGPGIYGSADIVFNPVDNMIYGWSGNPKLLFFINPQNGQQTKVPGNAPLAVNSWGWTGAMYFNAQGDILGYQSTNMIKIDPTTGIGILVGNGPSKSNNDGCSCSFGIEMTKSVSGDFNPGDTITYSFEFFNQSFSDINANVLFFDSLTNGLTWVSNPYDEDNLQFPGSLNVVGSELAAFTISSIPKGRSGFSMKAYIPCDFDQASYSNQASLQNLPSPLKEVIYSDDPSTNTISDPTSFAMNSNPLELQVNSQNVICETDGQVNVSVSGGMEPLNFLWNNGNTDLNLIGLSTGVYTLSVEDANGCQFTFEEEIIEENPIIDFEYSIENVNCNSTNTGILMFSSITGGTAPYDIYLNQELQTSDSISGLFAGTYSLEIIDQNGCISVSDILITEPVFKLELTAPDADKVAIGTIVDVQVMSNTLTPVVYNWTPDLGLSCNSCPNNVITGIESTVYQIIGSDINGCTDTVYYTLEVDEDPRVFIPNAFSPNGDGNNDLLMIFSPGDVALVRKFLIFDRWGNCVFNKASFQPNLSSNAWDGTFKGQKLNTGVYVYLAEIELINQKIHILKGDITLIR